MGDVVRKTIDKLKKENLKPASRWMFVVKKILMWSLVFLASVFSSIALTAVLFIVFQFDWNGRLNPANSVFFALRLLPYFWIVLAALFTFGVYEAVRHTKSGYRYDWTRVIFIVSGMVLGLGVLSYLADLGRRADFVARTTVPAYRHIVPSIKDQWLRPIEGFLAGEIISNADGAVILEDFDGNRWNVIIDGTTIISPMVEIVADEGIKIIGKEAEDGYFKALEIRPWRGNMMQRDFSHEEFRGGYYGPMHGVEDDDIMEERKRMRNRPRKGFSDDRDSDYDNDHEEEDDD